MVYDHADRLILSQDGNQRQKGQWTVNKYDVFGRLLYSGLLTSSNSRTTMANTYSGSVTNETYTGSGPECGYTCTNLTPSRLLTVNYYDNYGYLKLLDATTQGQLNPVNQSGYTYPDTLHVKSLLTGTRVYHLNDATKYETTAIYYDKYGRTVQTRATNHLGGYDLVYNLVDFTGKPTNTYITHSINGTTASVSEVYAYTYDKAQRLLSTTLQLNGGTKVILASNSYDPLGRLSSKQHQNGAETISYTYNIRSWLTGINDGSWQEQVYYDNDPSQPYYNGDIARSTWTYNGITKGYIYTYDGLNRLTYADYGEGSNLTTNQHAQDKDFTFDKMGNVTNIYRKNQGSVIDNVTLHYIGNHLKYGTDAAGASTLNGITEYTDDKDTIPEFYYDANGNLTADLDKNIVTIRYNVLNLPDTIQFGNGRQIINSYDAGGHKLTTQYYTPIGTVIVTQGSIHGSYTTANSVLLLDDYCGSYLYENGTSASVHPLTKILTPEGYIDMSTSGYPYCYYKQDHLGSNREVTSYSGTTGTVVQQTEYYPSGTAYVEGTGAGIQPFKFTGKELIIMHGLNWQDYGARWLDNVRMQWTTMDPLCEKYYAISPYTYCSDDPAKNIDPDGRSIWTKLAKLAIEGGNIAATLDGIRQDVNTIIQGKGTTLDQATAVLSLVSEVVLPVSLGDVKEATHFVEDAIHETKTGENVVEEAKNVSKGAEGTNVVKEGEGIIYKRTNPKTGKEYMGQAKSEDHYMKRQKAHDQAKGINHNYEIIDRGTPGLDLDVKEESAIRNGGGPNSKYSNGTLENKRHQMNDKRYKQAGGTETNNYQ